MTAADSPVLSRRVRGRSLLWITPTIKDLMKKCYKSQKCIKTNNELHWSSYTKLRNAVSMKLRKEKAGYYSSQLCENQDSRVNFENLTRAFTKQEATQNFECLSL